MNLLRHIQQLLRPQCSVINANPSPHIGQISAGGVWSPQQQQSFSQRSNAQFATDFSNTDLTVTQTVPGTGAIHTSGDGIEFLINEHGYFTLETGYSDVDISAGQAVRTRVVDQSTPNGTQLNCTVYHPHANNSNALNISNQLCWGMLIKVTAEWFQNMVDDYGVIRSKQVEIKCTTEGPTGGRPMLYFHHVQDIGGNMTNTISVEGVNSYFVPVVASDANGSNRQDEFGNAIPQISYDAGNYHRFNLLDYIDEWIFIGGKAQEVDYPSANSGTYGIYVATQTQGAAALSRFTVTDGSPVCETDSLTVAATHGNFQIVDFGEWIVDTIGATSASVIDHTCVAIDSVFSNMLSGYPDWVTGAPLFTANFETGDMSEFTGAGLGGISVVSDGQAYSGNYHAEATLLTSSINNYGDYEDYGTAGNLATQLRDLVAQYAVSWDTFSGTGHNSQKTFIFQFYDSTWNGGSFSNANRKYQVIVEVGGDGSAYEGQYIVELLEWDNEGAGTLVDSVFVTQNSTTVGPTNGAWDTLRLNIELDTNGATALGVGNGNGTVQLWVNNQLVINYSNVNICNGDANVGMGRLLLTSATGSGTWDGAGTTMYWDNIIVDDTTNNMADMPTSPVVR